MKDTFRSRFHPVTFKVIKKIKNDHKLRSRWNSLELIEIQLFKEFLSIKDVLERNLIVNSLLALSIFYIRSNSVKWFSITKDQKLKLRESLFVYGETYYNESIRLLRLLISKKNFNIELAIVLSDLLSKVSIYEFKTLNNCVIFSKGVVSIFSKLFDCDKLSPEIRYILNFLNYSSKTIYFPVYRYHMLYEFRDMLNLLTPFIQNTSDSNKFLFNHLEKYLQILINSFEAENNNTNTIYQLLRNWLINLPSNIQLVDYLKDPIEIIILKLYKTLAKMLDNLFPFVNYLFLTNFLGVIQLFNEPVYQIKKHPWEYPELIQLDNYCTRVTTFFFKRLNILSIFVGYQNFNNSNEISFDNVLAGFNEIMIDKFNYQFIKLYNYVHLPCQVTFHEDLTDFIESSADIYQYNQHHLQHFKLENIFHSAAPFEHDPIVSLHMNHLGGDELVLSNQFDASTLNYNLFFNTVDSNKIRQSVDREYQNLFRCFSNSNGFNDINGCRFDKNNIVYNNPIEFKIDINKGLDPRDSDVKDLLQNPYYPFMNLNENNLRNFKIHEFLNKFSNNIITEADDTGFQLQDDLTDENW